MVVAFEHAAQFLAVYRSRVATFEKHCVCLVVCLVCPPVIVCTYAYVRVFVVCVPSAQRVMTRASIGCELGRGGCGVALNESRVRCTRIHIHIIYKKIMM